MASRAAIAAVTASIIAVCRQGHPPDRLKAEVLTRLRRVVPVDALWWATSDPSTLLFTQAFREGIPDQLIPYFVDNEFPAATSTSGPRWPGIATASPPCRARPTATSSRAPVTGTCSSRWASATSCALCCGPATPAGD